MLLRPLITGSMTSSSCSGSSRSASEVKPETSAKSAVISRRSSGSCPPPRRAVLRPAPRRSCGASRETSAADWFSRGIAAAPAVAAEAHAFRVLAAARRTHPAGHVRPSVGLLSPNTQARLCGFGETAAAVRIESSSLESPCSGSCAAAVGSSSSSHSGTGKDWSRDLLELNVFNIADIGDCAPVVKTAPGQGNLPGRGSPALCHRASVSASRGRLPPRRVTSRSHSAPGRRRV